MNSSAGAGNYRRGSSKGDKVIPKAFSFPLFFSHILSVFLTHHEASESTVDVWHVAVEVLVRAH